MNSIYNPYNKTALSRNKPSKPYRILIDNGYINKTDKVLDYGCGNNFDADYYNELDYDIFGYDKFNYVYNMPSLVNDKYNIVTSNYMFNVIPSLEDHKKVLEQLKDLSDNVYISVRSDVKAIKDNWIWSDREQGFWTSKGSFQRFYNETMIDILFGDVEYIHNGNDFKLFKLIKKIK